MKHCVNNFVMAFCLVLLNSCIAEAKQAQWITHSDFEHAANQWFQFRKEILLSEQPDELMTKIAADSKYWLYINGEMIVFEGQLKRGPNPNDTYYDEVDLAPYLQKGENVIAALVWYFGREGFSHKDSKQMGLWVENETFVTDSTWKITKAKAFQSTGNPQGNFRLPESNVRFDARLANPDWIDISYDDSNWDFAYSVGTEGVAPWNNLIKRPIPFFKTFPLIKVEDFSQQKNVVKLKLPYNMQYHAYLKVKAPEGKLIQIHPDNLHSLNDMPLRGEYLTKEGEQEYLHLPWLSGHEIHFIVDDGIDVLGLGYMESGYDTELDGTFVVSDDYLMRYFEKAQRTLFVNMRDTYFDCPDRERAQWIGDGIILMEEAFYLLNNNAIDLSKKMLNELLDWQQDDATMFGPVPAGNWNKELPQQILAAVGNYGIGNYYMYTGDKEMLIKAYPKVKHYLDLWQVEEDGTVPFRKGGWTWGDWGGQIDRQLAEHIWVYIALDNLSKMAGYLNLDDEVKVIRQKMVTIKNHVNTEFWTSEGYRSTGYNQEIDDRGNALAVVSGIADENKYESIIKLFHKVEHASPYMEKYVMEALFKMDEGKFAIERFKRRYANMVNHPTCTTLWEFWNYEASVNHAWSGGPLSVLYKNMAGIQPTKPGFEEFTVYPDLVGLDSIVCSFSTVKGVISLDIQTEKNKTFLKLGVPENSQAILRVPISSENVKFNNRQDVSLIRKDLHYKYFRIQPGNLHVEY